MKNTIVPSLSIVLTTQVIAQEKTLSGDGDISLRGYGRLADEAKGLSTSDLSGPSLGLTLKFGKF